MKPTTILIVLDGWGHREESTFNAIHQADTPTWDRLWQNYPRALLECSGEFVGLPPGQMGNSEVGHITIGAGRVVRQELQRIDDAVDDGSFASNPVMRALLDNSNTRTLHVFGLLSPGGVHSHENQVFAAISMALASERTVVLHAFLDGRDTPPKSAESSIRRAMKLADETASFRLGSISGRYYAMDRDNRWERTKQAFELYTLGRARFSAHVGLSGLQNAYDRGETDEFVVPTQIGDSAVVRDGDDILFMNFRADRVRQLCRAFVSDREDFPMARETRPRLNQLVCLTPYAGDIVSPCQYAKQVSVVFEPEEIIDTFGSILAESNKTQLRIAETEKYAHVTYFFSGGSEVELAGETRFFVPSPSVATYDMEPAMSAVAVTDKIEDAIREAKYDAIICNFANADMVGHTGNFAATKRAVECIDTCLERITNVTLTSGSNCVITADHGNAEEMVEATTKQPHTAHTVGVVPFLYVGNRFQHCVAHGSLQDIAPTMLKLLDMDVPTNMTGQSLLY